MMKQDCGNMEGLVSLNNYLMSLAAIINNIWRWLALISFWKIRSGKSPKPQLFSQNNKPHHHEDTDHDDHHEEASPPVASVPSVVDVDDDEGPTPTPTKGKFTVYYDEEDEVPVEHVEQEEAMDDAYDDSEWWQSWEGFLNLRLGHNHNGWYTSLDFKAINGNVVTLWHPHINQH
ncbi:hypothetical protein PIB30_011548 [Stylosanthes scabra]|uniref:Uncharacterized protein n=1 Tax=Stylosanthes scabra TaxID=79078 RepID=A0ABU6U7H6_9FABA|nr:hypothetical protein [Stylosanthes scabra]